LLFAFILQTAVPEFRAFHRCLARLIHSFHFHRTLGTRLAFSA
jgi:hypothetical protein